MYDVLRVILPFEISFKKKWEKTFKFMFFFPVFALSSCESNIKEKYQALLDDKKPVEHKFHTYVQDLD